MLRFGAGQTRELAGFRVRSPARFATTPLEDVRLFR
jgi:hypothetical protein